MSYILDALKKAEQKRQLSAKVPTLATVHRKPAPSRSATPFKLWPWIAGAVIVANAGIASWLLLPAGTSSTTSLDGSARSPSAPTAAAPKPTGAAPPAVDRGVPVPEPPAPAATPPAMAPIPAPAPAPPVATPRVTATTEPAKGPSSPATRPSPSSDATARRPAVEPIPTAKAPAPVASLPTRPVPAPVPTAAAPLPPVVARPGATAVSPRPSPAPTAPAEKAGHSPDRPAVAGVPLAVPARPADRTAPPQSTSPQEIPQAVQGMVAKLKLQMVVYSDVPTERLVFINNQKYVEGSTIDGALRLESISHDSAVLTYQGQRFVLRQ